MPLDARVTPLQPPLRLPQTVHNGGGPVKEPPRFSVLLDVKDSRYTERFETGEQVIFKHSILQVLLLLVDKT